MINYTRRALLTCLFLSVNIWVTTEISASYIKGYSIERVNR